MYNVPLNTTTASAHPETTSPILRNSLIVQVSGASILILIISVLLFFQHYQHRNKRSICTNIERANLALQRGEHARATEIYYGILVPYNKLSANEKRAVYPQIVQLHTTLQNSGVNGEKIAKKKLHLSWSFN